METLVRIFVIAEIHSVDDELSTKKIPNNRKKLYCSVCFLASAIIFGILIAISITILETIPSLPSSSIMIGNSDVVEVITVDPSIVDTVYFKQVHDFPDVNFYQDECSDIIRVRLIQNSTTQLSISNNTQYRIDEPYLINGSRVNYTFSVSGSLVDIPCIVDIHIFVLYVDYFQFILTGHVSNDSRSFCVPPDQLHANLTTVSLTVSLFPSSPVYYFIGVKGLSSTTLNYTVFSDVLEYDITNLSPTTCEFSKLSQTCSIPLGKYPGNQEVCFLASLKQQTEAFTLISITTSSQKARVQYIFGITILSISSFYGVANNNLFSNVLCNVH